MSTELDAEKRVGTRVAGKYQLERLLGAGGMGAVYEAEHSFTRRRVAVKLMHPMFARSGIAAERFLREAQAPGTIGHDGIVEVLDGGHDADGSLYLVLELLEGETLSKALERGRPSLQWLVVVMTELLDALDAAHAAGFVHRDIKPENVFLVPTDGDEPQVKLLDFGVAGVLAEEGARKPNLTRAGAVLGTPLYMSPEQALGRRVDARTDLWAVGAILYQALTGKPPFAGGNVQQLIVSISTEEHLPLSVAMPGLPLRMVKVVEKALEKDPELRWQSASEMAEALQQALIAGPRTLGDAPQRVRRIEEDAQARLGRIAIAVVIVLAAIAAAAFIVLQPEPRPAGEPEWTRERGSPVLEAPATSAASTAASAGATAMATTAGAAATLTAAATGASGTTSAPILPSVASAGAPSPMPTAPPTAPTGPALAPSTTEPDPADPPRGLDAEQLSRELSRHDAALQRCHQDVVVAALKVPGGGDRPELGVLQLDLALQVAASGQVRSVEVTGDGPDSLRRCVSEVARRFSFPRSDRDSEASVPIVFTPNIVRK
jgi:tRNA A-37 threonylcarbamoyl transferase component Bud32